MGVCLLAVLLLSYSPSMQGGFVWDDDAHVTRPALQSLSGLWRIWSRPGTTQQYYPLLHTAFWIEHLFLGNSTTGYHLLNVLLHALSAFLLVAILRRLAIPGAWLAAFLFALHPVQVESVAWISEQKNTLSTVFYLASALVYLHFDRTRERRRYLIAFGLFIAAILSKSVTATLPAALLVILWWERGRLDLKRDVAPLAPWLAVGAAMGLFTAHFEQTSIGAQGAAYSLTFLQRCLLAGRVVCFYAAKVFWPSNLTFIYPHWKIDAAAGWEYLFDAGVVAAAIVLVMLARKTRGPLAGFLFFVGTLFPVLGFLNVYPFRFSYVADHFQYVACLGLIVPVAAGLALAGPKLAGTLQRLESWAGPAVVVVFAFLTWTQSSLYADAFTLYSATVARNPQSWMARNNLAGVLMQTPGKSAEAIAQLKTAIQLNPDLAEPHNNLGLLLFDMPGREDDAIAEFRTAIRLNPNFAEAHNNLGTTLSNDPKRTSEAIAEYQAALRIQPDYAEAHNNLGSALSTLPNRQQDAVDEFEAAVRLNPYLAEAHANLGAAFARMSGRLAEAKMELRRALQLRPDMQRVQQMLDQLDSAQPSTGS